MENNYWCSSIIFSNVCINIHIHTCQISLLVTTNQEAAAARRTAPLQFLLLLPAQCITSSNAVKNEK